MSQICWEDESGHWLYGFIWYFSRWQSVTIWIFLYLYPQTTASRNTSILTVDMCMCRLMGPVRMLIAECETPSHQHHTTSPCLWISNPIFGSRHVTACGDRTKQRLNKAGTKGPIVWKRLETLLTMRRHMTSCRNEPGTDASERPLERAGEVPACVYLYLS